MMKKIMIFDDTTTSIQTSALELYRSILKRGFSISLFLDASYFNLQEPFYYNNDMIEVVELFKNDMTKADPYTKMVKYYILKILFRIKRKLNFNKKKVLKDILNKAETYNCIICTSETALKEILDCKEIPIPVIYYCTELYSEVLLSDEMKSTKKYRKYEKLKEYIQRCDLVIIQDESRWKIFSEANELINDFPHVFFPVSICDNDVSISNVKNNLVQNVVRLSENKKIIFYPTVLAPLRGCEELISCVEGLSEEYVLLIHGFNGGREYVQKLKKFENDRIIVSHGSLDYDELLLVNKLCWCGFLFYGESNWNDKYISNSCNKLVAYLQAGKPVITYGNESLKILCQTYNCGKTVERLSAKELEAVITEIEDNYNILSKGARTCFEQKYNAEKNVESLINYLNVEVKND